MSLKIRLRQQGRTNRQTYRLVVTDIRNPRDGKYLEMLGWYQPFGTHENNCYVDEARINYWLGQGAELSENVEALLKTRAPEIVKVLKQKKQKKRVQAAAKRR